MDHVLIVHYVVGILVAACAALLVWRQLGRRITLYVLTLQVVLGFWLISQGLRAPATHYSLAIVGLAGYMVANVMARKPGREKVALWITIVSTVCVLGAFGLGYEAAHPHM